MENKLKLLITGAKGFIGKELTKKAEESGYRVFEFDLPQYDILRYSDICLALEECDMCIHVAAMADLNKSIIEQDKNFEVNVRGAYNVGRACAEIKKPLIFISTCCVYGNHHDIQAKEERTYPQGREPYACSKIAGEFILRGIPGLDWCILRISTIYGVGMREELFTYIALNKIMHSDTVFINGTGEQNRQFLHLSDVVKGILAAVKHFQGGEIINLAGQKQITVNQVVTICESILSKKAKTEHRSSRYGETMIENIDISKAKKLIKWEPKVEFYDGMRDTFLDDLRFRY